MLKTAGIIQILTIILMSLNIYAISILPNSELDDMRDSYILDELLRQPNLNFAIINSLFMKESNPSLEESILKIIARMEQDNSVMDQAALHLLFVTGACNKRRGDAFRQRNKMLISGLLSDYLPGLVKHYSTLPVGEEAAKLRGMYVREINKLLVGNRFTDLSASLRELVVEKYLHSEPDPLLGCDAKRTILIYRTFDIEDELFEKCKQNPNSIADEHNLCRIMELSVELHGYDAARPFAEELIMRIKNKPTLNHSIQYKAMDTFVHADPKCCRDVMLPLAAINPIYFIGIYEASTLIAERQDNENAFDESSLDAFCNFLNVKLEDTVQQGNVASMGSAFAMYNEGILLLQQKGFHHGALHVCSRLDEVPGVNRKRAYWEIQVLKSISLEALDCCEEAKESYKRIMDTDVYCPMAKRMARDGMQSIGVKKTMRFPFEDNASGGVK